MALHRDIFWVGRQWAVTGSGIQAIDQRLRGVLDIEIARLWDDDFIESRRQKPGLKVEDFDKALAVARTRWPKVPVPEAFRPIPASLAAVSRPELARAADPLPPAPFRPALQLRVEGRLARFLPQWRVRR